MKSGREAYRDELVRLAREDDRIVCLEADLGGYNNLFQRAIPERYINVGIAEHTVIGMAGGLAKNGFIPFVSTFAPFATMRAAEMIKLSMAYMKLNIKMVCPYGGVSGAWFGPTHHCLEDLGVLQALPGICIATPHGENEVRDVVMWSVNVRSPVYIRLGRNGVYDDLKYLDPLVYPYPRRVDGWDFSKENILLVSLGEIGTEYVARYCRELQNKKMPYPHLHLPFVNKEALVEASKIIKLFKKVVVVEECRALTGIASSISLLNPKVEIYNMSPDDSWPSIGGSHEDILEEMGFSIGRLKQKIMTVLRE